MGQVWDEIQGLAGDPVALEGLRELVIQVQRWGKLDRGRAVWRHGDRAVQPMVRGLAALARHRADWLRPVGDWRPQSHNLKRQFGELARYLLAHYEVPRFMDGAWFETDEAAGRRYQGWFKHLGPAEISARRICRCG